MQVGVRGASASQVRRRVKEQGWGTGGGKGGERKDDTAAGEGGAGEGRDETDGAVRGGGDGEDFGEGFGGFGGEGLFGDPGSYGA